MECGLEQIIDMKTILTGVFIVLNYTINAQNMDNNKIVQMVNSQQCETLWSGSDISPQNLMFIDTVGICELKDLWLYTGVRASDSLQNFCIGEHSARKIPLQSYQMSFGWTISKPLNGFRLIEVFEFTREESKIVSRILLLIDTKGCLIFCTKYSH